MSLNVLTQGGGTSGASASIFVTGLTETDTVTAVKDSKTVRGKWVQKPNPSYIELPDEYTQLEYIESTGTQYIDTRFKPNNNTRFVLDANVETYNLDSAIFGARTAYQNKAFCLWTVQTTTAYQNDYGSSANVVSRKSSGRHLLDKNKNTLYVDGELIDTATNSAFSCDYSAYLFTINNGGSALTSYPTKAKLFSCQIYDNGVLIRDFVPARRNSDNVLGLYDIVNDVFYTNAGTGEFVAGEFPYGFLLSPITKYGMWSVAATNGKETKTQAVMVDAAVEFEIEMFYRVTVYSHGTFEIPCTHVSSGSLLYATLESDHIRCYCDFSNYNSQSFAGYRSTNKIDVTKYKKLKLEVYVDTAYNDYLHFAYGVSSASPTYGNWGSGSRVQAIGYGAPNYLGKTSILEIDLSDLSGEFYLMLGLSCYTQKAVESVRIYDWWIE